MKSEIYSKMLSTGSYSRYKYVDPTKNCTMKKLIVKITKFQQVLMSPDWFWDFGLNTKTVGMKNKQLEAWKGRNYYSTNIESHWLLQQHYPRYINHGMNLDGFREEQFNYIRANYFCDFVRAKPALKGLLWCIWQAEIAHWQPDKITDSIYQCLKTFLVCLNLHAILGLF